MLVKGDVDDDCVVVTGVVAERVVVDCVIVVDVDAGCVVLGVVVDCVLVVITVVVGDVDLVVAVVPVDKIAPAVDDVIGVEATSLKHS